MELNSTNKSNYVDKSIETFRDKDDNIVSVTSSDVSYFSENQFIELENKNYKYKNINVIDYGFNEFIVAEETTDEKVTNFFNSYNDVKDDIKIFGQTESHEFLFNSSKDYLGKNDIIAVSSTVYSNTIAENANLKDDLRVKDELCAAKIEAAERELVALYNTMASIKNSAISIIDTSLLPITDNLQLKNTFNSLKAILGQSVEYLIENKPDLVNKKISINNYDIGADTGKEILNNTITYNFLNDDDYLKTKFNEMLSNPEFAELHAIIADLRAQLSSTTDSEKIKQLENEIIRLNEIIESLQTDVSNIPENQLIKEYNEIYDNALVYSNDLISTADRWRSKSPSRNEIEILINKTDANLTSLKTKASENGNPIYSELYNLYKLFLESSLVLYANLLKYIVTSNTGNEFKYTLENFKYGLDNFTTKLNEMGRL